MQNKKTIFILFAIIVVASGNVGQAKQPTRSNSGLETRTNQSLSSMASNSFGRHWWATSNEEEKEGFLEGIDDCFTFDMKPRRYLFADYFTKIENYYHNVHSTGNSRRELSVEQVAENFGSSITNERDGEAVGRRDSLYWMNVSRERKIGFLEGFFSCRFSFGGNHSAWREPIAWYVSKLDIILARNVYSNVDDKSEKNMTIEAGLHDLKKASGTHHD
jgi:hypothetical protein